MTAEVEGEVHTDSGVLVIKRIHVRYTLRTGSEHRDTVDRVHRVHHDKCPVYRTIHRCVDITTDVELTDDD